MNKLFLTSLLLLIGLGIATIGAQAFGGEITNQPVRSLSFWRSEQFHGNSWLTDLASKPIVVAPVVTATTIQQCRYWDLYEKQFTIYSHGSGPAHLLTFHSGRYVGCTLFLTGVTPETRLASCQATCSTIGCSAIDCQQTTSLDGYWSAQ
ncbi:MAG: hypothetical protein AAB817_01280 [Patescibacteria group bacterium]